MEKLILIVLVFALWACGSNNKEQYNDCAKYSKIALHSIPKYLESLDTLALGTNIIIEFRISNEAEFAFGDLFLTGKYVSGQRVPNYYFKVNQLKVEVHLFVYCLNNHVSQKDSIETIKELYKEGLVVKNALEWTLNGTWSTQDFERLKFIFCKGESDSFTVNTRLQDVEEKLIFPNCSN